MERKMNSKTFSKHFNRILTLRKHAYGQREGPIFFGACVMREIAGKGL